MQPLNLSQLQPTRSILPPRIVLYGPTKIGKTTFASTIPGALLLDVEGGSGFLNMARIDRDRLDSYQGFMNTLQQIYEQEHHFTTLVIDTVDWLESLLFAQAAKEHNKTSIADVSYGAGYATAMNLWKEILYGLDLLREHKKMGIILLAHEQIRRYDNPLTDSYDRYSLKLHDKDKGSSSVSIIKEWVDAILFVNTEVFVKSEKIGGTKADPVKKGRGKAGDRVLHTTESPAFLAGNRYGLPEVLPFTWEALSGALNQAMTKE